MTNGEAIKELKLMRYNDANTGDMDRALAMAIEALSNSQNQPNSELKTKTDSVSEADVIYRQDAIDIVNRLIEDIKNCKVGTISFQDGVIDGYCRVRSELLVLPSTQPEIIRCKDCKKYDTHDHRCKHWNHGVVVMDWCSRAERRTDE